MRDVGCLVFGGPNADDIGNHDPSTPRPRPRATIARHLQHEHHCRIGNLEGRAPRPHPLLARLTRNDSHISRVLRAYYTEKGRPFPQWLPPDPKGAPPPVQFASSGRPRQAPMGGRAGGGLSDLWDTPAQQPQSQELLSLRRGVAGRGGERARPMHTRYSVSVPMNAWVVILNLPRIRVRHIRRRHPPANAWHDKHHLQPQCSSSGI
jgi:hypothetical protein